MNCSKNVALILKLLITIDYTKQSKWAVFRACDLNGQFKNERKRDKSSVRGPCRFLNLDEQIFHDSPHN